MEKQKKVAKKAPSANELAKTVQANRQPEKRNRIFKLAGKHTSSPYVMIQSADKPSGRRLLWFDEEKGYERALRYVRNLPNPFVDEQVETKAALAPGHVVFERGTLGVDAHNTALASFLDLHPWNEKNGGKGPVVFYEHDPVAIAEAQVKSIVQEAEALKHALEIDLATTEAILRPRIGSKVHTSKSEVLTKELLIYAKTDPAGFMEDLQNEQLMVNNAAYTAIDFKILSLKDNGRTLAWTETGEKLLSIPFGEDPYAYIGNWFTTDKGLEYLNKVTQKLKK